MTSRPVEVFAAPAGNAFMLDIATWIAEAAALLGRSARVVADGSLPGESLDDAVRFVVAPHEFFELSDRSRSARHAAAARSIPVATEQPGTPWFERSMSWCRRSPITFDINAAAVERLRARGVDAHLLRLGAVPSMDARRTGARSVDVTVLAGLTDHRAEQLAALAPTLWPHRCQLRVFPTDRPVTSGRFSAGSAATAPGGPVFGAAKYDLLADTRILLNLHRDDATTYFEWARVVEAMANGCVVVTEPSASIDPLVDGDHLVVSDDPARAIGELLGDPDRLGRVGAAAAAVVHGELALATSLQRVLSVADAAPVDPPFRPRRSTGGARRRSTDARSTWSRPAPAAFRPHRALRHELLDAVVAERGLRREIDALRCRSRHGTADHVEIVDSEAWEAGGADVSAVVTMFDYADVVAEALGTLAASTGVVVEIVIVDDHSTDDGRAVVTEWIGRHPNVPARLIGRDANRGLATARNLAIEHTRTDRVMVLDADNQVYPTCLRRLADALDADSDAAFSWSILEVFGDSVGLLSAHAWDPDRLVERNMIDAQVMLRRSAWEQLGGYRQLPGLLPGWEDWDLWLRLVEAGRHGVHVPEILGRYRSQGGSMVSGPNRFNDVMLERFEAAHPELTFPPR